MIEKRNRLNGDSSDEMMDSMNEEKNHSPSRNQKNHSSDNLPRLRFPEFVKDGEWEEKKIGDVLEGSRILSHENNPDKRITVRLNLKGVEKRQVRGTEAKEATYFFVRKKGQFIYGKQNLHKGAFGIIPEELDGYESSQDIPSFDFKDGFNPHYFFYYLSQDNIYPKFENIAKGTGSKRVHPEDFFKINIFFPTLPEQQKIASCLSSLDEVITAESQKLELLKDHKKGLLQNLFPNRLNFDSSDEMMDRMNEEKNHSPSRNQKNHSSDNVPRLRFPEFVKDGEWEEKRLGEVGEPLMCKRIFKEETTTNPKNGIPFYKIGTFGSLADSYISKELYEEYKSKYSFPRLGDILISASGTIGRLVIYDGSPAYFQDSNIIWLGHNEDVVINAFLFYYYSTLNWQTSDGGVIRRLYNSDLKRMIIQHPKKKAEQQKIASCLSSLDELIAAQSRKIELLRQHKKGLMQGLFPQMSDL